MDLLIDLGNTRLKWGVRSDRGLEVGPPVAYGRHPLEVIARDLWGDLAAPTRVVVSNVGGCDRGNGLARWVRENWGLEVHMVVSEAFAHGVKNAYREPRRLGVDRWACLLAACRHHRLPVCVVDCGTAITLDILDVGGIHRGGVIAPGLTLMRRALFAGTSDLEAVTGESGTLLADNTGPAIVNGTLLAAAGLVERGVREFQKACTVPLDLLFTGGDAEVVATRVDRPGKIVPDLVLQGLAIIAGVP